MAKVTHVKKARTDVYQHGLKTPADNKQKFNLDKSKPRDEKDTVIIPKGSSYYTWQLFHSPQQYSLTPPTKRQLTNNAHLLQMYDFEDVLSGLSPDNDDFVGEVESLISEVENYKDELDGRLNNMPDHLQEADSGQILTERIDSLDGFLDELNNVDLEIDIEEEVDEHELELEREDETDDEWEEKVQEKKNEILEQRRTEKRQEIIDELQGIEVPC